MNPIKIGRIGKIVLLTALAIYLALPILAIVLYAFATRWTTQVLPDGYTVQHWQSAFADPRLVHVLLRTFGLAIGVTLLVNLLVIPAIYWQWIYNPQIRPHMELTAAIPFVLPYVVIAFGIQSFSGQVIPFWQGTIGLLTLGHVAIAFPLFYWAIDGAMAAANVPLLDEVAQSCGAKPFTILWRVILPNIASGIVTGSTLVFATSFNEFVLVQLLIGNRFETISLYSLDLLAGANADFNKLAVVSCLTFAVVFILSAVTAYWDRGQTRRGL
ncbi:MAG: ABC transporter permease subunit [Elainellaceae cyanobacterium]